MKKLITLICMALIVGGCQTALDQSPAGAEGSETLTPPYNAFTGGQVTQHMEGRIDYPKYPASMRQLQNFFALKEGPVSKRPGTGFTGQLYDPNNTTARVIPFVFNTDDSYVLVFEPNEVGSGFLTVMKTVDGVSGRIEE